MSPAGYPALQYLQSGRVSKFEIFELQTEPALSRLFTGTPWDRPPTCDRCGKPESGCACPPPVAVPLRVDPAKQSPRLRLEKRPRGKVVTVVRDLDPAGTDLADLGTTAR